MEKLQQRVLGFSVQSGQTELQHLPWIYCLIRMWYDNGGDEKNKRLSSLCACWYWGGSAASLNPTTFSEILNDRWQRRKTGEETLLRSRKLTIVWWRGGCGVISFLLGLTENKVIQVFQKGLRSKSSSLRSQGKTSRGKNTGRKEGKTFHHHLSKQWTQRSKDKCLQQRINSCDTSVAFSIS